MKKIKVFHFMLILSLIFVFLFSSCGGTSEDTSCNASTEKNSEISDETGSEKYRRIEFGATEVGEYPPEYKHILNDKTIVENAHNKTYPKAITAYKIIPRNITQDMVESLTKTFDIKGDIQETSPGTKMILQTVDLEESLTSKQVIYYDNHVSLFVGYKEQIPLTKTDEELEAEARAVFEKLSFLHGEYQYLGDLSVQWVSTGDEEFTHVKRLSFRRVLDGMRVIGSEYCDIYICEQGVIQLELILFDYEAVGEIELEPLQYAIDNVKTPNVFSILSKVDFEEWSFEGQADLLRIENSAIHLINQYDDELDECQIVQPIYNLAGTISNEKDSAQFHSRIIAIPERYTYTAEPEEGE